MAKKKIAIIGVGKIAIDQHLPVIDRSPDFEVAATVSNRMIRHRDLPVFHTPAEFYKAMPKVELVAICTPPSVRHHLVREAIDAGKHVLMEKPPTTTISEFDDIVAATDRFIARFPQVQGFQLEDMLGTVFFKITPVAISLIDYTVHFGYSELVTPD